MAEKYFDYCLLVLFGICIAATTICLIILRYTKSKLINQKYLITNLLIEEILFCAIHSMLTYQNLNVIRLPQEFESIVLFVRIVIAFVYIATMHYISLDRLFEVYFHLSYPVRFTKKVILHVIIGIWLGGLLLALILQLLMRYQYNMNEILLGAFYFYFTTDVSCIIIAIITYSYLYLKFRQTNKVTMRQSRRFQNSFKSPKFQLPCLIILSYLLLDIPASILSVITYWLGLQSIIYRKIGLILAAFGILSNCCIYVLCNPSAREILVRKLTYLKSVFNDRLSTKRATLTFSHRSKIPKIIVHDAPNGSITVSESIVYENTHTDERSKFNGHKNYDHDSKKKISQFTKVEYTKKNDANYTS